MVVDGSFSPNRTVKPVPLGSVLGSLLSAFHSLTSDVEHKIFSKRMIYADDSIIFGPIATLSLRVSVAKSLQQDVLKCNVWNERRVMILNQAKIKKLY